MTIPKHVAVVGAGMAAIACARTLVQAGHQVSLFDDTAAVGGRMATIASPYGTFDAGAQYFTVRDPRFALALQTVPKLCKAWSANTVRVLDEHGMVAEAGLPPRDSHWVPTPGMCALLRQWAKPLVDAGVVHLETHVVSLQADALNAGQWQLQTTGTGGSMHVFSGFDAVVLAVPTGPAQSLLRSTPKGRAALKKTAKVSVAPCWTLMLAFPQAVQPGLTTLGPQWNAARSTHHRIAWLARESSKPGRSIVERWTVQASAAWSAEHVQDDSARVQAKMIKAFSEVTGIRAEPTYAQVQRWLYAQTLQPLGESHLWDRATGIGVCGDWCLGHRVEDAFISGLELALSITSAMA